jgi:hypothetical protein
MDSDYVMKEALPNQQLRVSDSKGKKARRRLLGKLGTVMKLPIDILFEVLQDSL